IEKSEILSDLLKKEKIKHEVLNAKLHEKESEIVAQAGRFGAVTIATNMAGRGTDIVLGGNPEFMAKQELKKLGYAPGYIDEVDSFLESDDEELRAAKIKYHELIEKYKGQTDAEARDVIAAGGLHIIGTERHESRRIDNQLRGRSGRQGDPGSSKFYISAEDDLIRLFAGERFKTVMETGDVAEGESIENPILTRLIESAQKKVESNNFAIRKHVLKYDDVMNKQREVIYGERKKVLEGLDISEDIQAMISGMISDEVDYTTAGIEDRSQWDVENLRKFLSETFTFGDKEFSVLRNINNISELKSKIEEYAKEIYEEKEKEFSEDAFREVERVVLLQMVDNKWMDHIDAMDQFRKGIGLRSMGNEDPVRAYQSEGFEMFEAMNKSIREDTIRLLYHVVNPEKMKRKR
ncbi:MAG: preprotein translocase subunit SecA, partial [Gallicola sp.]|nr:preprotein translocase subunit SecA [Gallicola sp.]